jgi:CHAD domain
VKAAPVRGIDAHRSVTRNAARIVRVRLDELASFDPAVRDPAAVTELHDMRIAAKRLRYVLEICGHCFGKAGARAEEEAKWLQEILGEIHDCDVLVPRVREGIELREHAAATRLVGLAEGDPDRLPGLVRRAPHATEMRGLATLAAALEARRRLLYQTFLDRWDTLLAEEFRDRLEAAMAEAEAASP